MKIRHVAEICRHNFLALMLVAAFPVYAQQESIVLDPVAGDYTITYQGLDLEANPKWHRVVYVPATKIEPVVKSMFRVSEKRVVAYAYKIRNGRHSRQPIDGFDIRATHADASTEITPKGWWAIITPDFDKSGQENGYIVGWSFEGSGGLAPDKVQQGFGFESSDIPGVGVAKLSGYVSVGVNGFPDEGPGDDEGVRSSV